MSTSRIRAGAAKQVAGRRRALTEHIQGFVAPVPDGSSSAADRNVEKVLMLLGSGDMTIAALLKEGVRSPAQSLYDLQLAGYPIERIRVSDQRGLASTHYHLGSQRPPSIDAPGRDRDRDRDRR